MFSSKAAAPAPTWAANVLTHADQQPTGRRCPQAVTRQRALELLHALPFVACRSVACAPYPGSAAKLCTTNITTKSPNHHRYCCTTAPSTVRMTWQPIPVSTCPWATLLVLCASRNSSRYDCLTVYMQLHAQMKRSVTCLLAYCPQHTSPYALCSLSDTWSYQAQQGKRASERPT